MGIKLGDISPLAGAISGKGMFGKGLGAMNKALGPMAGIMPRLAGSAQKKNAAKRAAMEIEMQKKGTGMRGRPMVEDIMMAEEAPAGAPMMKKGGKVSAAQAVHKHERNMHKGKKPTKFAKGGSTASKRADGCATKGKTKGRFV
jgi:hypothetical protein